MSTSFDWLSRIRPPFDGVVINAFEAQSLIRSGNMAVLIWRFDVDDLYLMCALTLNEAERVAFRDQLTTGVLEPIRARMRHRSALLIEENEAADSWRMVGYNIDSDLPEGEFIDDLYATLDPVHHPVLLDPEVVRQGQVLMQVRADLMADAR